MQDSTKYVEQHIEKASIPLECIYSSAGFSLGFFAFGGYKSQQELIDGEAVSSILWPFLTPLTTALGCHIEGSHFFKNNRGGFWSGVIGGFVGELIGGFISIDSHSILRSFLGFLIPSVGFTVLLYNGSADPEEPASNSHSLHPVISKGFNGVIYQYQF